MNSSDESPSQSRLRVLNSHYRAQFNNRRFSPGTREVFELLFRQTQEALDNGQSDYDCGAFARKLQDLTTIGKFVERKQKMTEDAERHKLLARMGEYQMTTCQKLKGANGEDWSFKKMWWVDIQRRLDEEESKEQAWRSIPNNPALRPAKTLHEELVRAMHAIGMSDTDQGFWEIRRYRDRNLAMYSGILDRRLEGKYDEVLKMIERDLRELPSILPDSESQWLDNYMTSIMRFRGDWFELRAKNGEQVWVMNARAKAYQQQLAKDTKDQKSSELNIIRKSLNKIEKLAEEVRETIGTTYETLREDNQRDQEALVKLMTSHYEYHIAAPVPPNTPQKRLLSQQGLHTPQSKRKREGEADAAFARMGDMQMDTSK